MIDVHATAMITIAFIGYGLAAVAFSVLALLILINHRGDRVGHALVGSAIAGAIWAGTLAFHVYALKSFQIPPAQWFAVELVRDAVFLTLLTLVLYRSAPTMELVRRWVRVLIGIGVIVALSIVAVAIGGFVDAAHDAVALRGFAIALFVVLAIMGLLLVEHIFRGTPPAERWTVKFLCFGMGAMFAFDFYMYSEGLLFRALDMNVWSARGYINALVAPMLGIAAARNPQWSVHITVSRQLVFRSVTLVGAGVYLLAMALTGYVIREIGGDWGIVGQTVFLFSALLLLIVLLFSGEMRARFKVFITKHFFHSKFDYREEWMTITEALSAAPLDASLRGIALDALANVVESTGGILFQVRGSDFTVTATNNFAAPTESAIAEQSQVANFLRNKHWVIDLDEFRRVPERYDELVLPEWLQMHPRAWLVIPLFHRSTLLGFVVLGQPRAPLVLNWEIRDMLLMTGRQLASHLALLDANEALIEARQFEAFNRLSAYVVHDLKNLVAQLALVTTNAQRHRNNPQFMDDVVRTIENAVSKMNKLLNQLRKGRMEAGDVKRASLHRVVLEVINHRSMQKPAPTVQFESDDVTVLANVERLTAVIEHIIQNAQDATRADGFVTVTVAKTASEAVVVVTDTGSGMEATFVRDNLFRPFRTTKGNAGMGIGVYESREFIQALGGKLEVESAVGVGTTFTIRLPIHLPENETNILAPSKTG